MRIGLELPRVEVTVELKIGTASGPLESATPTNEVAQVSAYTSSTVYTSSAEYISLFNIKNLC